MAWIRDNGWWLSGGGGGADAKPTHLLLDGGKARVPADSSGAFLNAYAIAVVRNLKPCVVELRTPVFKLFLDLDIKTASAAPPLDFAAVMALVQDRVAAFFDVDEPPRAVVCGTDTTDHGEFVKSGKHVVWTNVFATSATALSFREALLVDLETHVKDACYKPWASVVDACVFTSNGLRMPFSGKGRDKPAAYVPMCVWTGAVCEDVEPFSGVAGVRGWVHELSIRTFGRQETPVRDGVCVQEIVTGGACGTSRSLAGYESVLPLLQESLPAEFADQRFTGLVEMETCFFIRSSSRYCLNLGRKHNSCGIYWILSRKGVRQACYCRCETTEGRLTGEMCKDFKSEVWDVDDRVIKAFFPDDTPATFLDQPMPSVAQREKNGTVPGILAPCMLRYVRGVRKGGKRKR